MDCSLTLHPTTMSNPSVTACSRCGKESASPQQREKHEKHCLEGPGTQGGSSVGNKGDGGGLE